MTIHSWIPLIAGIAYVPLFVILIHNRPWQKQHYLFAWYLGAATLWSLSSAFVRSDFLVEYKLLLFRVVICSFVWATVQFYHFIKFYLFKSGGLGAKLGYTGLAILVAAASLRYVP